MRRSGGSRLAEAVLPAACSLARTLSARLLLVHVLEREPPAMVHGEPHHADAPQAAAYLEQRGADAQALLDEQTGKVRTSAAKLTSVTGLVFSLITALLCVRRLR